MSGKVTLTPLAMVTPNGQGVYAPSRLRQPKEIEYKFIKRYADHPRRILVSFEPDGVSNPQVMTAYGFGLDCWYLAEAQDETPRRLLAVSSGLT